MRTIHTLKKSKYMIALASASILALSACGSSTDDESTDSTDSSDATNETNIMTDAMGHEVEIPENPERVLGTYLEDYLVTLGVTPVAQWSAPNGTQVYLEDQLEGVPPISSELPLEEVASTNPDFILINDETQIESGLFEQYNSIAPTFVLGDEVTNDWRKTLTELGKILDKSEEADQALAEYESLVTDSKEEIQQSIGDDKVAAIWYVADTYYTVSPTQSSGATLFEDLELEPANIIADLPEDNIAQWNPVTLEALAELDADHLIFINSSEEAADDLLNDPVWANVPAVSKEQVYPVTRESSWLYNGLQAHKQTIESAKELLTN
ncbi:ABC transporter substrate-binding protein [Alkalicoccobacillus gibsonii]|uniref:ABC transporter substrate-binding protein n=1 Tax=Alkalicoccobacillus gibsonii TaxID=79881 RepID=UPI003F7BA8F9